MEEYRKKVCVRKVNIIYRKTAAVQYQTVFERHGFTDAFLRMTDFTVGDVYNKNAHRHEGFEIHVLLDGALIYEAEGKRFRIEKGHFLLIPPKVLHRMICAEENIKKVTFSFSAEPQTVAISKTELFNTPGELQSIFESMLAEKERKTFYSYELVENRAFEMLIKLLRAAGVSEGHAELNIDSGGTRFQVAKSYIDDNICRGVTVSELATYCHLSNKQLDRIFRKYEDMTAFSYIRKVRIERIKKLLMSGEYTVRQISDGMGFCDEYYFYAYFKANCGVSPQKYIKSVLQEEEK